MCAVASRRLRPHREHVDEGLREGQLTDMLTAVGASQFQGCSYVKGHARWMPASRRTGAQLLLLHVGKAAGMLLCIVDNDPELHAAATADNAAPTL